MIPVLKQRRENLAKLTNNPAILWSGCGIARNFPANRYPFRASSHFLYFAGLSLENAVIRLENGSLELFMDKYPSSWALWHGEMPKPEAIGDAIGAKAVYPLSELNNKTAGAATICLQDIKTYQHQCQLLGRVVVSPPQAEGIDLALAKAIITLRLHHDNLALEELREAARVTIKAHLTGMQTTVTATTEAQVRGAMEGVIIGENMTTSYNSIVTVHGEVLHNEQYHHNLRTGDLILADVGAETANGWAADITRVWPVTGKFSPTQRDIYNLVLAAHDACIAAIAPEVEYESIHFLAAKIITEGLVELGILQGNAEDLVEQDAHALFFPHGIGHLLGLDVHDMEDLGDLAGYAAGRNRSNRFGLGYLRLHRPLKAGMLVTIEPGFYQVPAILYNPEFRTRYEKIVNWEKLAQFADVRGIRIEDDVLVTESSREVLTEQLPNTIEEIESLIDLALRAPKQDLMKI